MRRYYLYTLLLILCFTSCKKEYIFDLSGGKPIIFSQELEVETKAAVPSGPLSSINGSSFGVRAYIYDTKWESEAAEAKPDVAWINKEIKCDEFGICSYEPLQRWISKKKYAFFGYFPYNIPEITLSNAETMGVPFFTYNLSDEAVGSANGWIGNQSKMYDVMFGSVIDANEILNSSVEIPFKHALYSVKIVAENFGEQTVYIENLSIKLDLQYRGIKIPMDGGQVEPIPFGTKPQQVQFDYLKSEDTPIEVISTLNSSPVNVSENKYLLLVPQGGITGEAIVKTTDKKETQTIPLKFPNTALTAGVQYVFDIQFVGEQLNLILIEGTQWDDNNSNIEFE